MAELYRPPGRTEGQPIVEVRTPVINRLGRPQVDYNLLEELFYQELEVPEHIVPTVRLYGRTGKTVSGFHVPFSRTIHIDAVKCVEDSPTRITESLLHQAEHLADSANDKLRTTWETAVYPGGVAAWEPTARSLVDTWAELIPDTLPLAKAGAKFVAPAVSALGAAWFYHQHIDPREERALEAEEDTARVRKYRGAIVFNANRR